MVLAVQSRNDDASVREAGSDRPVLASIAKLQKRYVSRDGGEIVALSDVSLNIHDGEFVSGVGPSGCGKSTLLHIMAGVLERTSGEILLRGRPIDGPRREVGIVFQEPLLLPWRTVLDNVLLPIEVHRLPIEQFRQRALELLELTGLAALAKKYTQELPGRMQQRAS